MTVCLFLLLVPAVVYVQFHEVGLFSKVHNNLA